MKLNAKNFPILFLSVILILVACELPAFSVSPAVTSLPSALETSIAQTVAVAQSQTALFLPSPTRTPTETLLPISTSTETPTPTATIVFLFPTSTFTRTITPTDNGLSNANDDPACRLISRDPANNQVLKPQTDFDARWVIENTSGSLWNEDNVDYIYYSGTKMHKESAYDLPQNVDVGESVTIIVDMIAPKKAGTYSTTWTLRSRQTEFCKLRISIVVK